MAKTRQQMQDAHDPSPAVLHLREQVELLEKALKEEKQARGEIESFLNQLMENITICDPVKLVYKPSRSKAIRHRASAVLDLGDWHIGKSVKAFEINNFNAYNYATAILRVEDLIAQHMRKVEMWRGIKDTSLDDLVIVVKGDMINGALRKGDIATNEFHECMQVVKAAELLTAMVMVLAPHFKRIRIEWVSTDNHSRLGKRVESAQPTNQLNFLLGKLIEAKLSAQKNITVNMHLGTVGVMKVHGTTYLIRHGHDITPGQGSTMGIPYYNIDRHLASEALARLGQGEDFAFDKVLLGHYHVEHDGARSRISMSLSGTDTFDRSRGRRSIPGQGGWMVHAMMGEEDVNNYKLGHIYTEPESYPEQQEVKINY